MQRAPGGDRHQHRLTGRDFLAGVGIVGVLVAADAGVNLMTRHQDREAATARVTACDDLAVQILDNGARGFRVGGRSYQLVFGLPNEAAVCHGSRPDTDTGDAAIEHYQACDAIGGLSGPNTATVVSPRNNRYRVQVQGNRATVCLLGD